MICKLEYITGLSLWGKTWIRAKQLQRCCKSWKAQQEEEQKTLKLKWKKTISRTMIESWLSVQASLN